MPQCDICEKRRTGSNQKLFYEVPVDEQRRQQWAQVCHVNQWQHNFVCADHFLPTDFKRGPLKVMLLPSAVPTDPLLAPVLRKECATQTDSAYFDKLEYEALEREKDALERKHALLSAEIKQRKLLRDAIITIAVQMNLEAKLSNFLNRN